MEMIASYRAKWLWEKLYPTLSMKDQFDHKFVSKRWSIRPDGDGFIRRETPCGAILVIAKGYFVVDVYPIGRAK